LALHLGETRTFWTINAISNLAFKVLESLAQSLDTSLILLMCRVPGLLIRKMQGYFMCWAKDHGEPIDTCLDFHIPVLIPRPFRAFTSELLGGRVGSEPLLPAMLFVEPLAESGPSFTILPISAIRLSKLAKETLPSSAAGEAGPCPGAR
jgi:hypothetical protein